MQRFQDILVVAPPKLSTGQVVARAAALAERNHARLTLIDVVPALTPRRRFVEHDGVQLDLQQLLIDTRRRELEEIAADVAANPEIVVSTGTRFSAVIQQVLRRGHDLVITAPDRLAQGRGFTSASTALHLLRKCPVPVWVDDPAAWNRGDVLVAVGPPADDGELGELNEMLLQLASSLARIQEGELHLVHAWSLEGELSFRQGKVKLPAETVDAMVDDERLLAEATMKRAADYVGEAGVPVRAHLVQGSPADVVTAVVEQESPEVVVMGTLARTGLGGLLIGNSAERIIGAIDASVLTVKPPGFITPLTADG